MQRSLLFSIVGHILVFGLLLILSWAFASRETRSYPKTITATFVAKSPSNSTARSAPRKVEPPKPEPTIKPAVKAKVNRQAVKKEPERRKPQPAAANKSADKNTPGLSSPGMKIDAPEFPFPEYLALIQYRIESQWQPPTNAGGGLLTTVYFRIGQQGDLSEIKVTKASGSFVVDQSALRAVYAANPLPPLPADSGLSSLGVHFDFVVY